MGDKFFKIFFASIFGVLILVGLAMFLNLERRSKDKKEVNEFVKSRGKEKIPSSWRDKIGFGI